MLKNLVTIALIAACISCQQKTIKGCVHFEKSSNACQACYRRLRTADGGCGALLTPSDTCLIHRERPGRPVICDLCRPGYGTTIWGTCAPLEIFDCLAGRFNPQSGKISCIVCGNGNFPSKDQTRCLLPTKPVPNCLWGGRSEFDTFCSRCEPNYVTSEEDRLKCVPQTAATKGCFLTNGGLVKHVMSS